MSSPRLPAPNIHRPPSRGNVVHHQPRPSPRALLSQMLQPIIHNLGVIDISLESGKNSVPGKDLISNHYSLLGELYRFCGLFDRFTTKTLHDWRISELNNPSLSPKPYIPGKCPINHYKPVLGACLETIIHSFLLTHHPKMNDSAFMMIEINTLEKSINHIRYYSLKLLSLLFHISFLPMLSPPLVTKSRTRIEVAAELFFNSLHNSLKSSSPSTASSIRLNVPSQFEIKVIDQKICQDLYFGMYNDAQSSSDCTYSTIQAQGCLHWKIHSRPFDKQSPKSSVSPAASARKKRRKNPSLSPRERSSSTSSSKSSSSLSSPQSHHPNQFKGTSVSQISLQEPLRFWPPYFGLPDKTSYISLSTEASQTLGSDSDPNSLTAGYSTHWSFSSSLLPKPPTRYTLPKMSKKQSSLYHEPEFPNEVTTIITEQRFGIFFGSSVNLTIETKRGQQYFLEIPIWTMSKPFVFLPCNFKGHHYSQAVATMFWAQFCQFPGLLVPKSSTNWDPWGVPASVPWHSHLGPALSRFFASHTGRGLDSQANHHLLSKFKTMYPPDQHHKFLRGPLGTSVPRVPKPRFSQSPRSSHTGSHSGSHVSPIVHYSNGNSPFPRMSVVPDISKPNVTPDITWAVFSRKNLPARPFTFWSWIWDALQMICFHPEEKRHDTTNHSLLNEMWNQQIIYGFCTRAHAHHCLRNSSPGTFLMRFADGTPGALSVAYVDSDASSPRNSFRKQNVKHLKPWTFSELEVRSLDKRIADIRQLWVVFPRMLSKEHIFHQLVFASKNPELNQVANLELTSASSQSQSNSSSFGDVGDDETDPEYVLTGLATTVIESPRTISSEGSSSRASVTSFSSRNSERSRYSPAVTDAIRTLELSLNPEQKRLLQTVLQEKDMFDNNSH